MAKGALAHSLQNPKWPPGGLKIADGVFGHSKQLSLKKFFDPSTPSMRKCCDVEEKKRRKERNSENSGNGIIDCQY